MLRSFARVLVGLVLLVGPSLRAAAQAEAPPRTRYTLHAELDEQGTLKGSAEILFVNTAQVPVDHLVFHLYPNAFDGPHTVFAREGGLALRGARGQVSGRLDMLELKTATGDDLLRSAQRELVPRDRTQLRVALARPVAPGRALELSARFFVLLPSLVARMGRAGDFFMLGQWFPKLAKLMPDGSFRSTPYHGTAEFDADFADYDLEVHVPKGFIVAAPGAPRIPREGSSNDKQAQRYVLDRARDIAWAAAPDLVRARVKSERGVAIEAFAPRGHSALAARQAERAARFVDRLSGWLTPYPYERLVIVLPPHAAHGAAGMEYAALVTGWSVGAHSALPGFATFHDYVTAHEIAHQWFPMLISNDEVAEPMLDEGLAQWLGLQLAGERYDRAFFDRWLGLPIDAWDITEAQLIASSRERFPFPVIPSSLSPAPSLSAHNLGRAVYARTSLVLQAVAARNGRDQVIAALARYARANRFAHPQRAELGVAFDAAIADRFAEHALFPALRGEPSELDAHHRTRDFAHERRTFEPSLFARALGLLQLALGWLGP